MENSLRNRIQKLMESEQMSPAAFAKAIQVNPSAISHILNDRNKPSTDILTKILSYFRTLNSEWLILGVGNMYKYDKQVDATDYLPSLFDTQSNTIQQKEPEITEPTTINETVQAKTVEITPNLSEPTHTIIEKEIIKEVMIKAPEKKVEKIIVYYSDNSFEEFSSNKAV